MRRTFLSITATTLILAFAGVAYTETFEGGRGDNRYIGTPNSDRVELFAGDDTAFGRGGADRIFGGPDNDRLHGEDGRDALFGHVGNDILVGGPGEDQLYGAPGNDTIYTGTVGESDKETDEISCGDGQDTVYLSGPEHSGHNIDENCENLISY